MSAFEWKVGDKLIRKKGHLYTSDQPGTIVKQHAGNRSLYDFKYDDERGGIARFVSAHEFKVKR